MRDDKDVLKNLAKLNKGPVKTEDGLKMSLILGAKDYVECSAKNLSGIENVFATVARVAVNSKRRRRKNKFLDCIRRC